jgi:tartrate-resistant acid phosphatase type 5
MKIRNVLACVACSVMPFAAHAQTSFLVIGDWGRDGAGYQTAVATQMALAATRVHADFVVSVGDNFYEEGVQKPTDNQFKTSFVDIYKAPSLQIPWYVAIGNHDYHGNVQAQIDYSALDPRWHMPARYFTIMRKVDDSTSLELFFLDTSPFVTQYRTEVAYKAHVAGIDVKAQVRWLDSALAGSTAQWKMVIGHHPVYSASPKHGNTPELIASIKPLLEKYHAQVYLCGHDHNLQHNRVGHVDYYVSGGGSEARTAGHRLYTKWSATSPGFLAIELTDETLHAQFFNQNGKMLDSSSVARVAPVTAAASARATATHE